MEYASNGKGNLGVTLGAIGTGLGVLQGGLGGIFNGVSSNGQTTTQNILDVVDLKTENAILKANMETLNKISTLESKVDAGFSQQGVINCGFNSSIAVLQNQMNQVFGLTKLVIPSTSVCTSSASTT